MLMVLQYLGMMDPSTGRPGEMLLYVLKGRPRGAPLRIGEDSCYHSRVACL